MALILQAQSSSSGVLFFCVGIPILAIIGFLVVQGNARNRQQEAINAAYATYQNSLTLLKSSPANADRKQTALATGRAYSALTRESKGVTLFDEMALMNDIQAATAGASSAPPQSSGATIESRLAQLEGLRTKGLVNEAEYQERRNKILSEV